MDTSNLFAQFNTEDSIYILLFMLIAFLFGLLVGYILRSRKVIALKRELKDKKKELSDAQAHIDSLKEELALKEADLKKADFAVHEAEARAERIEQEKATLHKQIFQLNQELDSKENISVDPAYETTIEELNKEIDVLKARNQQLEASLASSDDSTDNLAQMQSTYNATRYRLEALENRIEEVANENQTLKETIASLQHSPANHDDEALTFGTPPSAPEVVNTAIHPMPGLPDAELIEEEPEVIFNRDKTILEEKIILDQGPKDDLTLIEGVGPFLEKKLNEIGVYTYGEIATWDSKRIAEVTEAIGHFKGRIEKDQWVEQAAQLTLKKQQTPEAFTTSSVEAFSQDPEDLKVIEGIGPKIESVLKEAGILNWEQLANTSSDQIRDILEAAGGARYRVHDPETWPNQARLAHSGEWGVLKEYQDELVGGRDLEAS